MSTKQRSPRKKLMQFDFQKIKELQWKNEEEEDYFEREDEPKRGVARHHSWGSTSSTDSSGSSSSSVSSILRNSNNKDDRKCQHDETKSVSWKGTVRQRVYPRIPESQIPYLFYDRYDIEQFREDAYFETRFSVDYPELYEELEM